MALQELIEKGRAEFKKEFARTYDDEVHSGVTCDEINNFLETYATTVYNAALQEGKDLAVEFIKKNVLWGTNDKDDKCLYSENLDIVLEEARTALQALTQ